MYDVYQRIAILSGAFLTMGESDNHSIQFNIDQVYRLNSDSATALRVTGGSANPCVGGSEVTLRNDCTPTPQHQSIRGAVGIDMHEYTSRHHSS